MQEDHGGDTVIIFNFHRYRLPLLGLTRPEGTKPNYWTRFIVDCRHVKSV